MTDLTSLTLAEARKGLAAKTFTSLELTDAHLNAIEAARVLNAFVMETPDRARDMAKAVDEKIAKGLRPVEVKPSPIDWNSIVNAGPSWDDYPSGGND